MSNMPRQNRVWVEQSLREAHFLTGLLIGLNEATGRFVTPNEGRAVMAHALARAEGDFRLRLREAMIAEFALDPIRDCEKIDRGFETMGDVLSDYESKHSQ